MSVSKQLAEELHKLVIKKFKGRKVYARFKEISPNDKNVKYLLCVIDIFTKHAI